MFQLNKNLATLYQIAPSYPVYANTGINITTY
jgi:hypothetical protein